jgi:RES domain-containing protein
LTLTLCLPDRPLPRASYGFASVTGEADRQLCARSSHAESVAVKVGEVYLTTPRLVDDCSVELTRDGVDIGHAEVHERVGLSIASVLRKEQSGCAVTCEGHESWERRLEVVFPLLHETKALVPSNGAGRVAYTKNRDRLVPHAHRMPDPMSPVERRSAVTARVERRRLPSESVRWNMRT